VTVAQCLCADCSSREGRGPTHQVVCTCVETPCLACRSTGAPAGFFLSPVMHGRHYGAAAARVDANKCQGMAGRDGRHRYDVAELRADGWPFCPWCGEDELYSQMVPATRERICGCYRCGTSYPEAASYPLGMTDASIEVVRSARSSDRAAPLDLDGVLARASRSTTLVSNGDPMFALAVLEEDVPALVAEILALRTRLAEQQDEILDLHGMAGRDGRKG
jgi:hypothetical protein